MDKSIALKKSYNSWKVDFFCRMYIYKFRVCGLFRFSWRRGARCIRYVAEHKCSSGSTESSFISFPSFIYTTRIIIRMHDNAKIWSLINISTRAFRSRPTISSCCFCVRNRPRFELALCNFFHILPPSPIFRLFFFSSESLPVCLPRRRHHSSSSVSVAMQTACRSFNSPIARNKFYISTRMMSTYDGFFSSLLFAPLSSGKQSWIGKPSNRLWLARQAL